MSAGSINPLSFNKQTADTGVRFEDLQVELLGDSAAVVNATIRTGSKALNRVLQSAYTAVLVRYENGWKIRHDHYSWEENDAKKKPEEE